MTTKKSKSEAKKKPVPKSDNILAVLESLRPEASPIDSRRELLAKVAGSVAAGLVTSPSPSIASPSALATAAVASAMATAAVAIADEILKKAGIPATESSAETTKTPLTEDADLGSAS